MDAVDFTEPPGKSGCGGDGVQHCELFPGGRQVGGMCGDQGYLQHVPATEWIEPICHAVLAEGHVDARVHELSHPRCAPPDEATVAAALDDKVGYRVRHDRYIGPGTAGDDCLGVRLISC